MVRNLLLSAVVFSSCCAEGALAVEPSVVDADFANQPSALAWRPNGGSPSLSIAAFGQSGGAVSTDLQVSDFIATNRNRLFGIQSQLAAPKPLSTDMSSLVHPLSDPREAERLTSHAALTPISTFSSVTGRPTSFGGPLNGAALGAGASSMATRPAMAGTVQASPWLDSLRRQ
jgi:hypothetical protein